MNKIEKLIERAKYYERLTRQYHELTEFVRALKFSDDENISSVGVSSNGFRKRYELKISTPVSYVNELEEFDHVYGVNLVQDLGLEATNQRITQILIWDAENRIKVIEKELANAFGGE